VSEALAERTRRQHSAGARGRHSRVEPSKSGNLAHRFADVFALLRRPSSIAIGAGLVALGICIYQLTLPFDLFGIHGYSGDGYDDGVYLTASIDLIHGVLPYRDFDFLQPPGITILMAPIAFLSRAIGSRDALAVTRILTTAVTGLNAAFAALAVRAVGRTAMLFAGLALAAFPLAVAADHSLLLEPYLVLFCLLGVMVLFRDGAVAGGRRVFFAGLLFGFAGAIKLWAIFPVVAALVCCVPQWRRSLLRFVGGVVLGFGVPALPFILLAPTASVHQVLLDQLTRGTSGVGDLSVAQRLVLILGIGNLGNVQHRLGIAVAVAVAIAGCAVVAYALGIRARSAIQWFALFAAAVTTVGMLVSPEFYDHYAYFAATFVALLVAVIANRAVEGARWLQQRLRSPRARLAAKTLVGIPAFVTLAGVAALVPWDTSYAASFLGQSNDPGAFVASYIPKGACILSDEAIFAVNANRVSTNTSRCPAVVDPFGMWITRDHGNPPPAQGPYPRSFVDAWYSWFRRVDYVVLSIPQSDYIPWSPRLLTYFQRNFTLVASEARTYIYDRKTLDSSAANRLVAQGLAEEGAGNIDRAFADYSQAARVDPKNVYAHYDLGYVDQARGDTAAAFSQYRVALKLDPSFERALYNLGVLESPTDPAAAIGYYRSALRIQPKNAPAEFNLGVLLVRRGHRTEGDALIRAAISTDKALARDLPPNLRIPSTSRIHLSRGASGSQR
jgi:hypothetical protein